MRDREERPERTRAPGKYKDTGPESVCKKCPFVKCVYSLQTTFPLISQNPNNNLKVKERSNYFQSVRETEEPGPIAGTRAETHSHCSAMLQAQTGCCNKEET